MSWAASSRGAATLSSPLVDDLASIPSIIGSMMTAGVGIVPSSVTLGSRVEGDDGVSGRWEESWFSMLLRTIVPGHCGSLGHDPQ